MAKARALDIVIVGAGLAGLCTAFRLAKDGHKVTLYERKPKFEPAGGAIMIRPNASRIMQQWGLGDDFAAISDHSTATNYRNGFTGEILICRQPNTASAGHPDWGTFRDASQRVLMNHAKRAGVQFEWGVTVTGVSENSTTAFVFLSTRKTVEADLLLAADGVLSRLRAHIIPDGPPPEFGNVTFQQVFLHDFELAKHEETKSMLENAELNVWTVQGSGGYAVTRYCHKLHLFSALFSLPVTDHNNSLWEEEGNLSLVREHYKHYTPALATVLSLATSCDRWRTGQMPDLPSWTSQGGRLVLLGDSAHAMFPDATQGFGMIIEDIAVLSYLLSTCPNSEVSQITQTWQNIRQPRVNRIKAWALANHNLYTQGHETGSNKQATQQSAKYPSYADVEADRDADFMHPAFLKWVWGYDTMAEVEKYMGKMDIDPLI